MRFIKAVKLDASVVSSMNVNLSLAYKNIVANLEAKTTLKYVRTTRYDVDLRAVEGLVWTPGTTYTIQINPGFAKDKKNRLFTSIGTGINYITNPNPLIFTYYPPAGSNTEPENKIFTFMFNRKTMQEISGTVKLYEITPGGNVLLKTFESLPFTTIESSGINVWQMDVKGLIKAGGEYFVLITQYMFNDYDYFYFQGITDPNTWRFSIAGEPLFPGLTALIATLGQLNVSKINVKYGSVKTNATMAVTMYARPAAKQIAQALLSSTFTRTLTYIRRRSFTSAMSTVSSIPKCWLSHEQFGGSTIISAATMITNGLNVQFGESSISSAFSSTAIGYHIVFALSPQLLSTTSLTSSALMIPGLDARLFGDTNVNASGKVIFGTVTTLSSTTILTANLTGTELVDWIYLPSTLNNNTMYWGDYDFSGENIAVVEGGTQKIFMYNLLVHGQQHSNSSWFQQMSIVTGIDFDNTRIAMISSILALSTPNYEHDPAIFSSDGPLIESGRVDLYNLTNFTHSKALDPANSYQSASYVSDRNVGYSLSFANAQGAYRLVVGKPLLTPIRHPSGFSNNFLNSGSLTYDSQDSYTNNYGTYENTTDRFSGRDVKAGGTHYIVAGTTQAMVIEYGYGKNPVYTRTCASGSSYLDPYYNARDIVAINNTYFAVLAYESPNTYIRIYAISGGTLVTTLSFGTSTVASFTVPEDLTINELFVSLYSPTETTQQLAEVNAEKSIYRYNMTNGALIQELKASSDYDPVTFNPGPFTFFAESFTNLKVSGDYLTARYQSSSPKSGSYVDIAIFRINI